MHSHADGDNDLAVHRVLHGVPRHPIDAVARHPATTEQGALGEAHFPAARGPRDDDTMHIASVIRRDMASTMCSPTQSSPTCFLLRDTLTVSQSRRYRSIRPCAATAPLTTRCPRTWPTTTPISPASAECAPLPLHGADVDDVLAYTGPLSAFSDLFEHWNVLLEGFRLWSSNA